MKRNSNENYYVVTYVGYDNKVYTYPTTALLKPGESGFTAEIEEKFEGELILAIDKVSPELYFALMSDKAVW